MSRKERRAAAKLGRTAGTPSPLSALPTSPAEAAFQEGLRAHATGRFGEAEAYYRQALVTDPKHVGTLHYLGALALQFGQPAQAAQLIGQAVALKPDYADAHFNLGNALRATGQRAQAVQAFRRATELQPGLAHAHCNLGVTLQEMGEVDAALSAMRRAIAIDPNLFDAQANIAALLQRRGNMEEAIGHFHKVLAINPNHAESHFNLALALVETGKVDEALASIRRAQDLKPDFVETHAMLAQLLQNRGQGAVAIEELSRRAETSPHIAEIKAALADALQIDNRIAEAIELYTAAIKQKPRLANARIGLGVACKASGDVPAAIKWYREAIQIDPTAVAAYINLGSALSDQGDYRGARAALDQAMTLKPDMNGLAVRHAAVLPVIAPSLPELMAERERFVADFEALEASGYSFTDPLNAIGQTNFYLAYAGLDDRAIQEQIARFYLNACPSLGWNAIPGRPSPSGGTRYRIGIISAYLQNHTMGRLNQGLIEQMDRTRFEVVIFRPPGSTDEMSQAIDRAADQVIAIPRNLEVARRIIADAGVDLLFYTDIGMDVLTYFLCFAKLAPVQAMTWGHPVTTGVPAIDYFLSVDTMEPAGAEACYSEQLIRLRHPPTYYHRPNLAVADPSAGDIRAELGLPAEAHLYLCPQTLFKFHPDFDPTLAAILHGDPAGRLVLIAGQQQSYSELLISRIARSYPDLVDRITVVGFLPRADFLKLLTTADVVLDTRHFGGGNTSYESFSLGTPIVTWPGQFMRGRVTAGLYQAMGVTDLIAQSHDEFVALAHRLANDREWRAAIVEKIRNHADGLFENIASVREIETFFAAAIEAERTGGRVSHWP
jgi:predicted O-linked N-acetylglucosamine transferase (SPINDLY family)